MVNRKEKRCYLTRNTCSVVRELEIVFPCIYIQLPMYKYRLSLSWSGDLLRDLVLGVG